jgi:hypothetical protein
MYTVGKGSGRIIYAYVTISSTIGSKLMQHYVYYGTNCTVVG